MKIRTGFVSNSSSASFTLTWRIFGDEETDVEEALKVLMEYDDAFEDAKKHTKKLAKNIFQSNFWTCMLNGYSDLGTTAMALYFSLSMRKDCFEILDAKVEGD